MGQFVQKVDGVKKVYLDKKNQLEKLAHHLWEEERTRDQQVIAQTMQKVGYAYDYNFGKILDHITLSIALKQLSCVQLSKLDTDEA